MSNTREEQALIWDYYKPRHTHAWNMLVLSWRGLDQQTGEAIINLETEYFLGELHHPPLAISDHGKDVGKTGYGQRLNNRNREDVRCEF